MKIERLMEGKGAACELVLRTLPDWFGIEAAIQDYVRDVEAMPCWVAREGDEVVGFMALAAHRDWSREIHVMGVLPDRHGLGIGRALVETAEAAARDDGVRWLLVKTLGPSHPDAGYAKTRAFYLGCGFEPLEELMDLWPGNPALLLTKPLFSTPR